jgi:hypothetical protein
MRAKYANDMITIQIKKIPLLRGARICGIGCHIRPPQCDRSVIDWLGTWAADRDSLDDVLYIREEKVSTA